jgi:hypothetical protein
MEFKLKGNTVLERGKDVPFSHLDDELLAIDAQAGYCYSLNETAGRIWDLMATPISFDALCAQLQREYTIDEAACAREAAALLEGLHNAGFLEMSNAPDC